MFFTHLPVPLTKLEAKKFLNIPSLSSLNNTHVPGESSYCILPHTNNYTNVIR